MSISFSNLFSSDGSSLSGWTTNGITINTSFGNPAPSFASTGDGQYAYINPARLSSLVGYTILVDMYTSGTTPLSDFFFGCNSSGAGQMFRLEARGGTNSGFRNTGSWTSLFAPPNATYVLLPNTWYRIKIVINSTATNGMSWYFNNTLGGNGTFVDMGGYIGLQSDGGGGTNLDYWDNIVIYQNNVIPASITYSMATSAQFYINVKGDTVVPSKDDTGGSTLTNTNGAVVLATDATRGKVLSFNGTNASFITNYYLPIIHTRLFWVKLNGIAGQPNNTLSTNNRPLFYNGGPSIIFSMNFSGGIGTWRYDTVSITTGTWYFYALTYDGTTAKLYTNGVLKKNEVVTSYQTPEILEIGSYVGANFLSGYLDNIRCYNSVLNETQIQDIYNYELANPTSFYYENGYTIPPSIGYTLTILAIPQPFNTVNSNTLTVSNALNPIQNGTYIASASSYRGSGNEPWRMLFGGVSSGSTIRTLWQSAYSGNNGYTQQPYGASGVYQGGGTALLTYSTTVENIGPIGGEWVQIKLPYKLQLSTYSLYPRQDSLALNWSSRYPSIYYIVGSNDGTTWYQVDYRTFSSPITPSNGPLTYTIGSNTNYYSYFRLITNASITVGANTAVIHYGDWALTGYVSTI